MTDLDLDAILKRARSVRNRDDHWTRRATTLARIDVPHLVAEVERLTAENELLAAHVTDYRDTLIPGRDDEIDALQSRIDAALALCDQASGPSSLSPFIHHANLRAALTGGTDD